MFARTIIPGCIGLVAAMAVYVLMALHFASVDPRSFFAAEPGVRQIENLSPDFPRVALPDLLKDTWDYACFVRPYHDVAADPKLAGILLPWVDSDGFNTIVLRKGANYELHKFSRGAVSIFELSGLSESEACFDGTALVVEYVDTSREGFTTLRVVPLPLDR